MLNSKASFSLFKRNWRRQLVIDSFIIRVESASETKEKEMNMPTR